MSTFIGLLLVFAAVVLFFFRKAFQVKVDAHDPSQKDRWGSPIPAPANPFAWFDSPKFVGLIVVGLVLAIQSQCWFYARPGHQYFIVTPSGGEYAVVESGVKLILPFSKVQEWQNFIDIKVVDDGEPTEGIEGVINEGIPIRFIDQVTAKVKISARMQLPADAPSFIALAKEFRHPMNLVNNTLIPTVKEQVINTGYMFSAQDYTSGSAADFRTAIDEQLKNGAYSVEKKEILDTAFVNIDIQNPGDRQVKEVQTRYEVTKRIDKTGHPIRIPHDITKNNIIVSQVIVDQVDLEEAFRKRLESQRDISAQKKIELEKIETAKAAQQRIIAEGERDKASERASQEIEQVKVLIAIETQKKQEVTRKELAAIALETARLEAQRMKVNAEAKRVELQLAEGLSEEQKYQYDIELKKAQAFAEALKQMKLPSTVVMTGEKNSDAGLLEALIGADLAKKMIENPEKK